MGGKSSKIEVSHYHMSLHVGLSLKVDAVLKAFYGEKLYWSGYNTDNTTYTVSNTGLFGGDKKEGGVAGEMTILMGKTDQTLPEKFAAKLGLTSATVPGFRGVTSVLHTGPVNGQNGWLWCANSPYLKSMWYTVQAIPRSLGSEYSEIDGGSFQASVELGPTSSGWRYKIVDQSDPTDYSAVGIPDSDWPTGPLPFAYAPVIDQEFLVQNGYSIYRGTLWPVNTNVWLRKKVALTFLSNLTLNLVVDNYVKMWVNGVQVLPETGGGNLDRNIVVNVPQELLKVGDNLFVVMAKDDVGSRPGDGTYFAMKLASYSAVGTLNANPAHIIFDVLTDPTDGMGLDPSVAVNIESFQAAAKTLFDEGLGLSMAWSTSTQARDFIDEILAHINAVIFDDPVTGKITLKLIRNDYVVASLRNVNRDNATVKTFSRKAWGETINEIVVTWTNPSSEAEETVTLQDNGNIAEQGEVISDSKNYYGVRSAELAWTLAARDLRVAAAPLCSADISLDRSFWSIVPGDCVTLTWPEYGIENLVMRVWEVNYGKRNSGSITVKVTEDVFSLPVSAFVKPPSSEWVDVSSEPEPIAKSQIMTLPAFIVASVAESSLTSFEYPTEYAGVLAAAPNSDTSSFELIARTTDVTGTLVWETRGTKQISGYGKLSSSLVEEVESTIENFATSSGPQPVQGDILVLGSGGDTINELCLVMSVNPGNQVVIRRAILDTVPRQWPAGTEVWVIDKDFIIADETQQAAGVSPTYKLLPNTSNGQLDASLAPAITGTLNERLCAPFRPADIALNGLKFGTLTLPSKSSVLVEFARRNRLTEERVILPWDSADVTPETGQTTRIDIVFTNGVLHESVTGITGTSVSFDTADMAFPTPPDEEGFDTFFVDVLSELSGIESLQKCRRIIRLPAGSANGDFYFNNVTLLMHMDGTDGGSVFTDNSSFARTVTRNGNVRTNTTQKKFGTASAYFSGTENLVVTGPVSDFYPGVTDDYTVECFVFLPSGRTTPRNICGITSAGGYDTMGFQIEPNGRLHFYLQTSAGQIVASSAVGATPEGAWVHVAGVKLGSELSVYVNGVRGPTRGNLTTTVVTPNSGLSIGAVGGWTGNRFIGHIDEFRITKGVARYSGNFDPPASPFYDHFLPS